MLYIVCSAVPQRVPYDLTSDKPDNQKNYKQLLTCCKVFIIPYKYILSLLSDDVNKNITYILYFISFK